jgi:phage portal protein BeeE
MAIACEEYGAKFFANGAAPSGVLEEGMKSMSFS